MRSEHIIVVPCAATASAFDRTIEILSDHELPHESMSPDALTPYLTLSPKPVLAMVHAGRLAVDVIEVLRYLTLHRVPTMTLLEQATEEHEMTLLQSGAWEVINLEHTSDRKLRTRITTFYRNMSTLAAAPVTEAYTLEAVVVDVDRREVRIDGATIDLSKVEFNLLVTLLRSPDGVCTREELAAVLTETSSESRSLEVNMSRLRVKIESAGGPRIGESVRGVGYRLTA